MPASNFDTFILNAATRHGLLLYIGLAVASVLLASYLDARLQNRQPQDFTSLLVGQLTYLCLFLAFAALSGQFPKTLWLATLLVGVGAWIVWQLLTWTAQLSDIRKLSAEAKIALAVAFSKPPFLIVVVASFVIIEGILRIGLLIYCAFLFDPGQMGKVDYQAKMALFTLVLPTAPGFILILLLQIRMLISEYTTPAIRNLYLPGAVFNVAVSSIVVFGALYAYRDGFPRIAELIPPLGTLVMVVVTAFAVLLIVPYAVGYLRNRRLAISLQASVEKFIARAEELAKLSKSDHRQREENRLLENIIKSYASLTKNQLLFFFVLKLLENFAQDAISSDAKYRRLAMLQSLGFGVQGEFNGNPIAEIQQIRARIAEYEANANVRIYFTKVEDDLDTVAEVHPLLLNSARLTEVLGALVDADPNSADIFNDLRAKSVKAKGNPIPGWLLSFLTAAVVNPFSNTIVAGSRPW